MRFSDRLQLALHNISQSKSRSLLTVVIVFIVGMLISVLVLLGINFASNTNKYSIDVFEKEGTSYTFSGHTIYREVSYETESVTKAEFMKLSEIMADNSNLINRVYSQNDFSIALNDYYISGNSYLFDYNYDFLTNKEDFLVQGRIWTKEDSNTGNIWVSQDFVKSYYNITGKQIKPDDNIIVTLIIYLPNGSANVPVQCTVKGICNKMDKESYIWETPNIIFDMTYMYNNVNKLNVNRINLDYKAPDVNYNLKSIRTQMNAFVNSVNAGATPSLDNDGKEIPRFYCELLDTLQNIFYINLIIVGLAVILGFIVLLLSIGSIANSVIINIDKNRRFTGLLKAMGLRHTSIKSIVYIESSISILVGIGLTMGGIFVLKNIMAKLQKTIMDSLFGKGFEAVFNIPIYLPFAIIFVFIFMAIAFSRGGLKRMEKMDVISIISEVG